MPKSAIDPKKRVLAQRLRANVTDAEKKTWYMVRDRRILGAKFRRQQVILDRGAREPPQAGASPRTAPPKGGSGSKAP